MSSEIAKAIKDAQNVAKVGNPLDDEMEEPKESKAIRVEHGVNDTFEIPFNDTYRKFNRYAINKMILWYDKNNSVNVDEDGDESMRKHAFHGRGGRGGGRGKGRGGYHNNHNRRNGKRFSTQEYMDNKRAKHVQEASSSKPTLKEVIDAGNAEGARELAKFKKNMAEKQLEEEIANKVLEKNKLIKDHEGKFIDSPESYNMPDDKVFVNNKGPQDAVGEWIPLKKFKDIIREQFLVNHRFEEK